MAILFDEKLLLKSGILSIDCLSSTPSFRCNIFKNKLQEVSKGSLSITYYFLQMKEIVDTLYAIGEPIIDDELLIHIFGGLSHEFDVIIVNL